MNVSGSLNVALKLTHSENREQEVNVGPVLNALVQFAIHRYFLNERSWGTCRRQFWPIFVIFLFVRWVN